MRLASSELVFRHDALPLQE